MANPLRQCQTVYLGTAGSFKEGAVQESIKTEWKVSRTHIRDIAGY